MDLMVHSEEKSQDKEFEVESKSLPSSPQQLPKLAFKKQQKQLATSQIPSSSKTSPMKPIPHPGKFVITGGRLTKSDGIFSNQSVVSKQTPPLDKENQDPAKKQMGNMNRVVFKKLESSTEVAAKHPKVKNVLEFRF